jgi:hypothetical protein
MVGSLRELKKTSPVETTNVPNLQPKGLTLEEIGSLKAIVNENLRKIDRWQNSTGCAILIIILFTVLFLYSSISLLQGNRATDVVLGFPVSCLVIIIVSFLARRWLSKSRKLKKETEIFDETLQENGIGIIRI